MRMCVRRLQNPNAAGPHCGAHGGELGSGADNSGAAYRMAAHRTETTGSARPGKGVGRQEVPPSSSDWRDFYESIERGDYPRWTMFIQVMTEEQALSHRVNPFDLTKVWPRGEFPLIEVGVMELNRNPDNVFAEVEQSSFAPSTIVPGIGFSPDRMLQARLFSYGDAARYRLGVNHHQIPVNAPRCPVHSFHRDGAMRTDGNHGGTLSYVPNSKGEWDEQPDFHEPPLRLDGAGSHWDHRVDDDH